MVRQIRLPKQECQTTSKAYVTLGAWRALTAVGHVYTLKCALTDEHIIQGLSTNTEIEIFLSRRTY